MKWIHDFSTFTVPFYIYKLNKEDCILYRSNKDNQTSLIILHGTIFILKIFTNGETLSIAILNKNHTINMKENTCHPKHHYYKAIALETTYIISFHWQDIINQDKIPPIIFTNLIKSYHNTIYRYEQMNHIITHKYIRYRIIQLIFFLCQEFGSTKKKETIIPFEISQINMSIIIGSNKVTTNKIIKKLCSQMLIQYSSNKKIMLKDPLTLNYIKYSKYK